LEMIQLIGVLNSGEEMLMR
ncbi:hypothetical protein A2U01_0045779, partial [Trifolium medium]|nr:hypothetical protein [Trifolium medium]